jgi:VanZ family protein
LKNDFPVREKRIQQDTRSAWYSAPLALFTPLRCRILAGVFFVLMVTIGAMPGRAQVLSDAFGDKLLHFLAYSVLACLLFGGLTGSAASRAWRTLLMVGLLGAADETIQSLISYRTASIGDWLVDMLAAGLALTVLIKLSSNRRHR